MWKPPKLPREKKVPEHITLHKTGLNPGEKIYNRDVKKTVLGAVPSYTSELCKLEKIHTLLRKGSRHGNSKRSWDRLLHLSTPINVEYTLYVHAHYHLISAAIQLATDVYDAFYGHAS